MNDSTDRQFEEAEAAITRAVTAFVSEIELMSGKWEAVTPSYIVEGVLVELCEELSEQADELKPIMGPATHRLLAAMADYRDARSEDR